MLQKEKPDKFLLLASPPALLTQFYVEVRRKDGTDYSKSSLVALRFGLCRFIKAHKREIDIVSLRRQIAYLRLK